MSEQKHTPTPQKHITAELKYDAFTTEPDKYLLWIIKDGKSLQLIRLTDKDIAETIVSAVNNHDELVDALWTAHSYILNQVPLSNEAKICLAIISRALAKVERGE
jgi:hypothetical protein